MRVADFQARTGAQQRGAEIILGEPWLLPVAHLSASQLNMLQRCPRQYQCRYVLGLKEAPGAAKVLGSAFHGAQEHNWRQKIETHEDVPVAEVVEFFHDKAWPDAVEGAGGEAEIKWDGAPEETRATGAAMTAVYREAVAPRVQPTAVERELRLDIGLPVPLLGYIDVETAGPTIDTKTSRAKRTTPKADWRLQGRVYRLLRPAPVDWHVITKAKVPTVWTPLEAAPLHEPYSELEAQLTREHVLQLAALANHYMSVYGPDDPWPATGLAHDWACDWCAYRSSCPVWRET